MFEFTYVFALTASMALAFDGTPAENDGRQRT